MLFATPNCEADAFTKNICENDQESVTHKPLKSLASVRSDRYHAIFF